MNSGLAKFKYYFPLYVFLLPALIMTVIFAYLPMISNVIAFMDYDLFDGFMGLGSPFVGFKNFFFLKDPWFYTLLGRTVVYSLTVFVFQFPANIILALLFNEIRNKLFKRLSQTISYLPQFVSWVTVASLTTMFLSIDTYGIVNNIKVALLGGERVLFMQEPGYFLPLLIITNLWKSTGFGTVMLLASISAINPELYESATVDGANRWQKMWGITLPCITPIIALSLIMSMGSFLGTNFDQIFNLQNDIIRSDTNTIGMYTYYAGITEQKYALATAVGLFNGVASFLLVLLSNTVSKKLSGISYFGRFS